MTEIIFEVTEDEVDGGYSASALGYGIHTQAPRIHVPRAEARMERSFTPRASRWKRSAITSRKPLTATSTRP